MYYLIDTYLQYKTPELALFLLFIDIDREEEIIDQSTPTLGVTELGPRLEKLWSYSCGATKARNVSCVTWNKRNPVSICEPLSDEKFF